MMGLFFRFFPSLKVVNFYLALVARESGTAGNLRVYAFSTFFYSKLCKDGPTHTSWDRWMRRGNIAFFDYDLILIPIHQANHWTLTVTTFHHFFRRQFSLI